MDTGLYGIGLEGFARNGGSFSDRPEKPRAKYSRAGFFWLPVIVIAGLGGWVLLSGHAGNTAESSEPAQLATATAAPLPAVAPAGVALQEGGSLNPATAEAILPEERAPADGLKISSQSWRRGGLGSNALVTFTLRNTNDYAVKNIELFCTFARRDGSHLTDRTRLLGDSLNMKSRKTFTRLHVGFVNVNADKAKCSVVAANHS